MSETVVVTGGAGFIGSHIVDVFVEAGYDVVVVDNLRTGTLANVHSAARFHEVDICDAEALERVFARQSPRSSRTRPRWPTCKPAWLIRSSMPRST